ncbi:replication protein A, subunit RPA32 [Viridothelium virens]|uniref:Replication protein A, subunit RPA32 n=1 Tax=Viridothelium virens TaxID=1048519 RepID=A0A6A6HM95_VIRVR|nr:replication protein A, subunit RPA32 [Viridothelium virens]
MDYGYSAQYSTTSYGAQGGAGGGGFLNQGSQESPAGGKQNQYGKDTLRPVTIKQILDAQQPHPDAELKIDGTEASHVTFVGQIRNVSTQATNITYKFDDGTGTVEVKQWIDADAGNAMEMDDSKPKLVENTYARVWGRMKAFNTRRHVGSHAIRPIANMNEVQCHLLEATVAHLHITRGPPESARPQGATINGDVAQRNAGYAGTGGLGSLSPHARRIMQCLQTVEQSNEGLHMHDIAQRLQMDMADVGKGGDELLAQGMIYTTVDDNTWAPLIL